LEEIMRTDSNTVLSLPSGVPPKKSALTKASTNNGAAFENDFNRAKETIRPQKPSATDAPAASSSSVSSSATDAPAASSSSVSSSANSSSTTTKTLDKNAAPISGNDKVSTSSTGSSGVVAVTKLAVAAPAVSQDSGKALQQDGQVSPADGLLIAVSAENSKLLATAVPSDLQYTEIDSSLLSDFDGAQQEEAGAQNLLADNAVVGDVGPVAVAPIATENASKDAVVTGLSSGAGVVGLDTIRRTVVSDVKNINSALNETTASEDVIEPSVGDDKSELSWVLSQMEASGVKAPPASSIGETVLNTTKVASSVAAGVIAAGAMGKGSRTEPVPASLLNEGDLSGESNLNVADALLDEDGVLINEPIELRKKEQETLLGRMSAQIDGKQNDDASPGGLNSSLHNNASRPAVAAAALNASMSNPQANNLAMSLPPGHPGWANEMSQKVAWIARDGGHTAHIRLDPPELGSLTVKVSVDSDSNTQISFIAATPQARDLLEGQMGRLREMLAQQGMDLSRADVDVSQQDTSGAQDRANNRNNGSPQGSVASNDEVDEELIAKNLSYVSASGIDYYA
jgi:flagellar hook-length control protein FliK